MKGRILIRKFSPATGVRSRHERRDDRHLHHAVSQVRGCPASDQRQHGPNMEPSAQRGREGGLSQRRGSTNQGGAMGRGYLTVGDLIAEVSGFDPHLPIKLVISDADDEPHSDAVLKRPTCSMTRLSNSSLGGGERSDVLLLK